MATYGFSTKQAGAGDRLAYFKTEDGAKLLSVQTLTNRHTPERVMSRHTESGSKANIRNSKSFANNTAKKQPSSS